ncbi:MAG: GNAT family N-acetyltransferase [Candidatus Fimivivens sp.]
MSNAIIIRPASPEDAEALLKIYAPYVINTAISFEYTVPSVEEFAQRIRDTLVFYPYLVALHNGEIVGYAYAATFKPRAAYATSVENSIYIAQSHHGGGVGRALYEKLEVVLRHQNILNLNACIAFPDGEDEYLTANSAKFHEKLGYQTVAHFHKCAFKFNSWYDMIWMEKLLGVHTLPPDPVRPFWDVWRAHFE